jgi:hypothetical protein
MYARNNLFVGRGVKSVRNPSFRELQPRKPLTVSPSDSAAYAAKLRADLIAKGHIKPVATAGA